jgi:hypothetical protein
LVDVSIQLQTFLRMRINERRLIQDVITTENCCVSHKCSLLRSYPSLKTHIALKHPLPSLPPKGFPASKPAFQSPSKVAHSHISPNPRLSKAPNSVLEWFLFLLEYLSIKLMRVRGQITLADLIPPKQAFSRHRVEPNQAEEGGTVRR